MPVAQRSPDPVILAFLSSTAFAVRKISQLDDELGRGLLELIEEQFTAQSADFEPDDQRRATTWIQLVHRMVEQG